MKILITNDDGIGAAGLVPLVQWAKQYGEVTVIAPRVEQSAKSHAIEIRKSFRLDKVELVEGVTAYALDSTPADCVRFALLGQHETYDLVISGINRGLNIGVDIIYSGTVAAVFEANNLGVPAIAFSTTPGYYSQAHNHLDDIFRYIRDNRLLDACNMLNVNIPADPGRMVITRQGGNYYSDEFTLDYGMVTPHGKDVFQPSQDDTVDTDCVLRCGNISIMPLSNNRTDMAVYRMLAEKLN